MLKTVRQTPIFNSCQGSTEMATQNWQRSNVEGWLARFRTCSLSGFVPWVPLISTGTSHWADLGRMAPLAMTELITASCSNSLLATLDPAMTASQRCSFNVYESKISTARLVGFLQLKIERAYTAAQLNYVPLGPCLRVRSWTTYSGHRPNHLLGPEAVMFILPAQ